MPSDLTQQGRAVLIVLLFAILGWTATPINDTAVAVAVAVAVAAAVTLVVAGAIDSKDLYGALGHELIWLLIAACIMAAVLRSSGIVEPLLLSVSRLGSNVSRLFHLLTAAIAEAHPLLVGAAEDAARMVRVGLALARRERPNQLGGLTGFFGGRSVASRHSAIARRAPA